MSAARLSLFSHARCAVGIRRIGALAATAILTLGIFGGTASAAVPGRVAAAHSLTTATARGRIVREAASHLGARYRYGATGPSSFDCSGFTRYIYSRFGVSLPHSSGAQSRVVHLIPSARKQPGDLVFFRTRSGRIDHVGIYAYGNFVYAASRGAGRVKLQAIYTGRISVGRFG